MDNQNYPNEQQEPQYQEQPYYTNQPEEKRPEKPESHLAVAILCTLLCCLPLGVVSIVYAAKVDGLYNSGDYQGAQEASDNAQKWAKWGAIIGILGLLCYLAFLATTGFLAQDF